MKKSILFYGLAAALLVPAISFAALAGVKGLLKEISVILGLLKPILFGLALTYFFWGTGQFILHAGNEKIRQEGKTKMLWGIIALFVMFSIIGILNFVGEAIGIPVGGGGNSTGFTLQ